MHELSITRSVVAIVTEHAGGQPVRRVTLQIGRMSGIVPEAVRFCFDIVAAGTPAAGAVLDIIEVPGQARCRQCGESVLLDIPVGCCGCGSTDLEKIAGEELRVIEMEVADVHDMRM